MENQETGSQVAEYVKKAIRMSRTDHVTATVWVYDVERALQELKQQAHDSGLDWSLDRLHSGAVGCLAYDETSPTCVWHVEVWHALIGSDVRTEDGFVGKCTGMRVVDEDQESSIRLFVTRNQWVRAEKVRKYASGLVNALKESVRREAEQALVLLGTFGTHSGSPEPWMYWKYTDDRAPDWLPTKHGAEYRSVLHNSFGDLVVPYGWKVVFRGDTGDPECPVCENWGPGNCDLCEEDGRIYWGEEWKLIVFEWIGYEQNR